jgi:hypothetical protein
MIESGVGLVPAKKRSKKRYHPMVHGTGSGFEVVFLDPENVGKGGEGRGLTLSFPQGSHSRQISASLIHLGHTILGSQSFRERLESRF